MVQQVSKHLGFRYKSLTWSYKWYDVYNWYRSLLVRALSYMRARIHRHTEREIFFRKDLFSLNNASHREISLQV